MFNVTTENVTWSKYHRVWITTVLKISLITYFPHQLGIIYIWMENSSIPIIQHIWIFIRQRNTVLWVFDVFISISININNEIDMSALYRFKCLIWTYIFEMRPWAIEHWCFKRSALECIVSPLFIYSKWSGFNQMNGHGWLFENKKKCCNCLCVLICWKPFPSGTETEHSDEK